MPLLYCILRSKLLSTFVKVLQKCKCKCTLNPTCILHYPVCLSTMSCHIFTMCKLWTWIIKAHIGQSSHSRVCEHMLQTGAQDLSKRNVSTSSYIHQNNYPILQRQVDESQAYAINWQLCLFCWNELAYKVCKLCVCVWARGRMRAHVHDAYGWWV